MTGNANAQYLQNDILSSDPIQLVRRLYGGALKSIAEARTRLRAGDIPGRVREVTRAHAILAELAQSLDHTRGGELSQNLARLYDYLQRRLLEGNFRQSEAPFAEAEGLLRTLLEGWNQCQLAADSEPLPAMSSDCVFAHMDGYEPVSVAG
jgi:flagellar protein FliS